MADEKRYKSEELITVTQMDTAQLSTNGVMIFDDTWVKLEGPQKNLSQRNRKPTDSTHELTTDRFCESQLLVLGTNEFI